MKCWKCGSPMMLDNGEPFCLTCGNRLTAPPVMANGLPHPVHIKRRSRYTPRPRKKKASK